MPHSVPLPGPIESDPAGDIYDIARQASALLGEDRRDGFPALTLARMMLDTATRNIEVGAYDEVIINWLKDWDVPTIATIASLLRRAYEAGVNDGRTEHAINDVNEANELTLERFEHAFEAITNAATDAEFILDDERSDARYGLQAFLGRVKSQLEVYKGWLG